MLLFSFDSSSIFNPSVSLTPLLLRSLLHESVRSMFGVIGTGKYEAEILTVEEGKRNNYEQ